MAHFFKKKTSGGGANLSSNPSDAKRISVLLDETKQKKENEKRFRQKIKEKEKHLKVTLVIEGSP